MTVFQLVLFGCAMCVLLVSLGAIAWLEDHRDLALSRQRSVVSLARTCRRAMNSAWRAGARAPTVGWSVPDSSTE
jgi:hypothetical protein